MSHRDDATARTEEAGASPSRPGPELPAARWRSRLASMWRRIGRGLETFADGAELTEASLLRARVERLERQVAALVRVDGDQAARAPTSPGGLETPP